MPAYRVKELMNEATIANGSTLPATIAGTECEVLNLTDDNDLTLTAECVFDVAATGDAVIHVRTSSTGGTAVATEWDTVDFTSFTLTCDAGNRVQKTIVIEAAPQHMKIMVENEDAVKSITSVVVTAVTTGV